jgi:hypothetical protein
VFSGWRPRPSIAHQTASITGLSHQKRHADWLCTPSDENDALLSWEVTKTVDACHTLSSGGSACFSRLEHTSGWKACQSRVGGGRLPGHPLLTSPAGQSRMLPRSRRRLIPRVARVSPGWESHVGLALHDDGPLKPQAGAGCRGVGCTRVPLGGCSREP